MSKPAAIFVAAAIAVTAGCVAVIASYGLQLGVAESALAGFAALAFMAVIHLAFMRQAPAADPRVDDIDSLVTELQSRLETAEARIAMLDGATAERARAAVRPLVDEIAALGGLVTTVAKEVASHDVAIGHLKSAAQAPVPPTPAPPVVERTPAADPPPPVPEPPLAAPVRTVPAAAKMQAPEPFDPDAVEGAGEASDMAGRVARALAEDRVEPHLQPIVGLPARRVAHYEALARLVEDDGVLAAEHFLGAAPAQIAEIDRRTLERCASIALRLSARGSGAVFVNVAPATLRDADACAAMAATFERQTELRRLIVLELPQAAFAALGAAERAALDAFTAQGIRLSLDDATDLRLDLRELTRQGVRFVKTRAETLLDPEAARGAAIHPADLTGLLARHGVDLIATHVEEERVVPELLDMDVRFGQGFLFGVPRPARPAAPEAAAPKPLAAGRLVPRSAASR